jgi:hypothetical protein
MVVVMCKDSLAMEEVGVRLNSSVSTEKPNAVLVYSVAPTDNVRVNVVVSCIALFSMLVATMLEDAGLKE